MQKSVQWSVVSGLVISAAYFLYQHKFEFALTAIIIPVLVVLLQFLLQSKPGAENPGSTRWSFFFKGRDFQKQYFTLLRYQNRDFDIKGLSTQPDHALELEQVFIELRLQSQVAHKASADPLQNSPSRIGTDNHPIWWFFTLLGEEKAQNPKLVIVGPPGSGKTTLLRHMALLLTLSTKSEEYKKIKLKKIPVLLYFRDHVAEVLENPAIMLPALVESNIAKWDVPISPEWFSRKMKKGACVILLDGLDEVADTQARRKIVTWLEKQILAYPKNAFIITSRPHGYKENPAGGVSVLEVMPFNRGQIDNFVQKWYLANEIKSHAADDPGVRMTAKSGADDLLRRLEKTPTLMELAVNPLLLTMIATVHRYRSALPGRRVELYKEICEVFLGKRQESKGVNLDLVPAQKQAVLQSLAFEMMCRNIREIKKSDAIEIIKGPLSLVKTELDPDVFLKSVEQQSGLLLEREVGVYGFAHKTFQEYLASMYILEKDRESQLYDRINDDWWHEVIKLYTAQTDATNIITFCLDQDPPSATALSLAIQCLEEARQVQPHLRAAAEKILLETTEDPDPEIRAIVAQALLSNRLKNLAALSPSVSIDMKLVTNAEYQIFINDMIWRGRYGYCPTHWVEKHFSSGSSHAPVLGLTPESALAFCEWLTEKHSGSGEWYFRLPIRHEIVDKDYAELPGFWLLPHHEKKNSPIPATVLIWNNPLSQQHVPNEFILTTSQEDIRNIIAALRIEGRRINDISDEPYILVSSAIKRITKYLPKTDELLSDVANRLYKIINQPPFSRAVDFGYGGADLEAYDQSISDSIDSIRNQDFESAVMNSMMCFSDLVHSSEKGSSRYKPLFIAFAFEFFIVWLERNKTFLARIKTNGMQKKIDQLLDWYLDCLIVHGRRSKVLDPFEGLLLVREIRERHFQ